MGKRFSLPVVAVIVVVLLVCGCILPGEGQICGGLMGISCSEGYTCEYDAEPGTTDVFGKCMPETTSSTYPPSMNASAKICQIGQKYGVSASSRYLDCICPENYEFDSSIIGYSHDGDIESPILEVECVLTSSSPKNCDLYGIPMTDAQIEFCTCPEGETKFYSMAGAYCATDSRKPCSTQVDCPTGEECVSSDGVEWFCTGQFAGCIHRDPENPELMICVD